MRQTGNLIVVAPTKEITVQEMPELESQLQNEELAPLQTAFIRVLHAKTSDLAALLRSPQGRFLSGRGSVDVDERTNTLIVKEIAAQLDQVRSIIDNLDFPIPQH